jgi:hypothetical protein
MRSVAHPSLVVSFAVLSIVSLAALGVGLVLEMKGRIPRDALRDARDVASVTARFGIARPLAADELDRWLEQVERRGLYTVARAPASQPLAATA